MQLNTKKENYANKKIPPPPFFKMHFLVDDTNFVVVCVEIKEFVVPVICFFSSPAVQISQEKKNHVDILFFD